MFLTAALVILAAIHGHRAVTGRIVGIVFIIIGGFTFTFRRALIARNPEAAPRYARTVGPATSALFVVVGIILIAAG